MPKLQVDPPGRALSTPLCPGEAAGGGERYGEKRLQEEEDRLSPAVGSFTHPGLPRSVSPFGFLLFLRTCVLQYQCA